LIKVARERNRPQGHDAVSLLGCVRKAAYPVIAHELR